MPEGHAIHRFARDHHRWFCDQRIRAISPQGRFADEAEILSGSRLNSVTAYGKHLFYHWRRELITHVHLGLYGKFRMTRNPAPDPRGAVRLRMIGETRTIDLNGPNCCELIDASGFRAITSRLGEDPLREDASVDVLISKMQGTARPIGSVLLDQSVIAGVGNIYRTEILFLMGIHPLKPARELDRESVANMWQLTVRLLRKGVRQNQIITRVANSPRSGQRLNIYKRSVCPQCKGVIQCYELTARKIFSCRRCQVF